MAKDAKSKKGKKSKKHGTYKLKAIVTKDGCVRIRQQIRHLTAGEVNSILDATKAELAKEIGGVDPADELSNMLMAGLKKALQDKTEVGRRMATHRSPDGEEPSKTTSEDSKVTDNSSEKLEDDNNKAKA